MGEKIIRINMKEYLDMLLHSINYKKILKIEDEMEKVSGKGRAFDEIVNKIEKGEFIVI